MAASAECKVCGCHLTQGDVRQLALYYRQSNPSLVAVQYVCPRCGTTEWQQYSPDEWEDESLDVPYDWSTLARELGLMVGRPSASGEGHGFTNGLEQAIDLAGPIGVDEYIEFGRRVESLSLDDLRALTDTLL